MSFIRLLDRGETHDPDGCPLTFAELSPYVTKEEHQWEKDRNRMRNVSQVNTSSSNIRSNSNSNSKPAAPAKEPVYNKETGEPLHCFIFAINVGILY
mmetsp:Transcript_723/g.1168  ORF Transcript_723/g.1168 Transcript_723/m.1168 type:complete len:97 (-) Transcript_723:736-1026(-)